MTHKIEHHEDDDTSGSRKKYRGAKAIKYAYNPFLDSQSCG